MGALDCGFSVRHVAQCDACEGPSVGVRAWSLDAFFLIIQKPNKIMEQFHLSNTLLNNGRPEPRASSQQSRAVVPAPDDYIPPYARYIDKNTERYSQKSSSKVSGDRYDVDPYPTRRMARLHRFIIGGSSKKHFIYLYAFSFLCR